MALITLNTFEARTGRSLSQVQANQVDGLIDDASALVVDIVDDSDVTDTWDEDTVPASVVPAVVAMVRRGLDNPHGFSGESAEGGYSYTGASRTGIFATKEERRAIRRAAGKNSVRALQLEGFLPVEPRRLDSDNDLTL